MIQTLQLSQFRSYDSGLFEFKPGVNIIVGSNASGKTNLLEAIHVIATMHGFSAADRDLIQEDKDWSRVEAMTDDTLRIVKLRSDAQNTISIDGVEKKRLTTESSFPVVVFEPGHMLLLSNESERRRAYLDGILSATVHGYKSELTAYKRALTQRNRLLKSEHFSQDQLFVWDVQLSQRAGTIAQARAALVEKLNSVCQAHYNRISGHDETLNLSCVSKISADNYADNLLAYLREHVTTDRQRGFTGAGPHRDDVRIELKGSDARITASRGETRSIILALKIAELEIIQEHRNKPPLFLLDDVFSELDGGRRRALAEALKDYQTFITTTDADVVISHFATCNIIPMG